MSKIARSKLTQSRKDAKKRKGPLRDFASDAQFPLNLPPEFRHVVNSVNYFVSSQRTTPQHTRIATKTSDGSHH